MSINYDELDPGIRDVVRAINEWGWKTTDSGDGSKAGEMECALPYPHVVAETSHKGIAESAEGLAACLNRRFGPGWHVEATYSTKDEKALLVAIKDAAHEDAADVSAIDKAAEEPHAHSDVAAVRRRSDDRADVAAIEEAMQDPRPSVTWETVKAEIEKEENPDGV